MSKTVRLASNVVAERFEDEAIIINLIAGNYYSLRGTSFFAWSCLDAGMTTEQVLNQLIARYPQAGKALVDSFDAFLSKLKSENLVKEEVARSEGSPSIPVNNLPKEFQSLEIDVFTDMQDLLLLDPIHEVEEEKGWPFRKEN
jgi:hypothetical protein